MSGPKIRRQRDLRRRVPPNEALTGRPHVQDLVSGDGIRNLDCRRPRADFPLVASPARQRLSWVLVMRNRRDLLSYFADLAFNIENCGVAELFL